MFLFRFISKLYTVVGLVILPTASISCERFEVAVPVDIAEALGGLECAPYAELGSGQGVICEWGFEYRAERATQHYDTLVRRVSECFPDLDFDDDDQVNHPDTYTQAIFELPKVNLAVSLKDKAALSQTLVFLKITASN